MHLFLIPIGCHFLDCEALLVNLVFSICEMIITVCSGFGIGRNYQTVLSISRQWLPRHRDA